ncbi:hypothetical protein J4H92_02075 [Leucobacter weissii]|uniref:Uncharacterized protein n=1 Tax=Leucobacter weissii TaxID=1983706 RepID=A0A939MGZ6_9MICO|nr:hypothetical protein [Leucobacter weissii]MBO1900734.1 hypothetical protein [Leucobacter weissii]
MNDDELREFLESATIGGDEPEEDETQDPAPGPAAPAVGANPAPYGQPVAAPPAHQGGAQPSFEEVIGAGHDPGSPEVTPLILPGPPPSARAARRQSAPRTAQPAAPVPEQAPAVPTAPFPRQPDAAQAAPFVAPSTQELPAALGFGPSAEPARPTDYEPVSATGQERRRSRLMPWIVTGVGAAVVLVAAVLIVLAIRGNGADPAPTTAPTTPPVTPTAPAEDPTPEPEPEPDDDADEAPEVEVGQTGNFPIPDWGVNGQISEKFGWPQFRFEGADNETLILLGGTLLPQFPDSCAEMREGFGLTRDAEGEIEVHRPAETCAEAPELYNEVWGLVAATVPTFE